MTGLAHATGLSGLTQVETCFTAVRTPHPRQYVRELPRSLLQNAD